MCLIVHKDKKTNTYVPDSLFNYNKYYNPDGFGVAWRDSKGLQYEKFGPNEYEQFKHLASQVVDTPNLESVIHFRRATQGPPCKELSHPFEYTDEAGNKNLVFHNGIIDIAAEKHESDTQVFVRDYLTQLPPRWWKVPVVKKLIEDRIGWSRILLMTPKETVKLNADEWINDRGLWYSTDPWPVYSSKGVSLSRDDMLSCDIVGVTAVDNKLIPIKKDDLYLSEPEDGWEDHNGHFLKKLSSETTELDEYGQIECVECHTQGEYYFWEGQRWFDVSHFYMS